MLIMCLRLRRFILYFLARRIRIGITVDVIIITQMATIASVSLSILLTWRILCEFKTFIQLSYEQYKYTLLQ